jgi:hypothetical protein
MDVEPWYAARCIFRHRAGHVRPSTYEERIILLRAHDFDHAVRRAEEEARGYAGSLEGVEYLECLDIYHLFEDAIGDGTEVFSLMRDSELGPKEYISRFFQTGSERSRPVGPERLALPVDPSGPSAE